MANDGRAPAREQGTAADQQQPTPAVQVRDLLRDQPPLGAPPEVRRAWLARKADVLDAIATEAADEPGLVDPAEARLVAARARVLQVAEVRPPVGGLSAAVEPGDLKVDLEEQLVESRKRLRVAADYLAGLQGSRYRADAPDPELLAGALETLASLATTMAAEARRGKVAW